MAVVADAVQQCRHSAADTRGHGGGCRSCSAHRLRECGQSAAGPLIRPSSRIERSARDGSQPRAFVETTSYRRSHPFSTGHSRRTSGGVLVPARPGALATSAVGSRHVLARGNRRARNVVERWYLLDRDADCRVNPGVSNAEPRSCRTLEGRSLRRGWRPGKSVDALRARRLTGLFELHFGGWSGLVARKFGKDSNHKPGLHHNQRSDDRCVAGRGGLRRAASQNLSRRTD